MVEQGNQQLEANLSTMLRQIRGSANYWNSRRNELRTMVRCLGPPTFFITLSAAEYDWEDMREMLISLNNGIDGFADWRSGQQCAFDPVMTTRHFHHRFRAFLQQSSSSQRWWSSR